MVLAVAVDPFTQQILSFETRAAELTNATASIGASRIFEGGRVVKEGRVLQDVSDIELSHAIIRGVSSPG